MVKIGVAPGISLFTAAAKADPFDSKVAASTRAGIGAVAVPISDTMLECELL